MHRNRCLLGVVRAGALVARDDGRFLRDMVVGATLTLKLGMAIGLHPTDLRGFAQACMIADLLSLSIILGVWRTNLNLTLRELRQTIAPSLMITLLFASTVLASCQNPENWSELPRLACVSMIALVSWLTLVQCCKHPLSHEVRIVVNELRNVRIKA